ncbi:MAG: hypothetical protein ACTSUB_09390 [Candidatus Thorarchaeota archaeon]
MPEKNKSCQKCGKSINKETVTCPFCGHKQGQKTEGSAAIKKGQELYRGDRGSSGGRIDDGMRSRRTHASSGSIKEAVRKGGRDGNVQVCMKCKHVQSKIRDNCESCGATLKK